MSLPHDFAPYSIKMVRDYETSPCVYAVFNQQNVRIASFDQYQDAVDAVRLFQSADRAMANALQAKMED